MGTFVGRTSPVADLDQCHLTLEGNRYETAWIAVFSNPRSIIQTRGSIRRDSRRLVISCYVDILGSPLT